MKKIKFKSLTNKEQELINLAHTVSSHTLSRSGDRIGSVIVDQNNQIFQGASIARMRASSSTCAERMALDNLLFSQKSIPKLVVLIGNIVGKEAGFCTPCGACRQIFQEIKQIKKLKKILGET